MVNTFKNKQAYRDNISFKNKNILLDRIKEESYQVVDLDKAIVFKYDPQEKNMLLEAPNNHYNNSIRLLVTMQ
jgi:hypothetical protein